MNRLHYYLSHFLIFLMVFTVTPIVWAQTNSGQNFIPPDFTTTELEAELTIIESAEGLSEEQKSQAKTYLETAINSLAAAAKSLENRARFATELENSPETLSELKTSIEDAQDALAVVPETSDEPMREEALLQLEQDLIAKESELRSLRSELEGYDTGLQTLSSRQIAAPKELNEARPKFGEITTNLNSLGDGELDIVAESNRKALQARRYFRRAQIAALEQEIAGIPKRQELTATRRQLADIKLQRLMEEVQYLSEKTGQRRLNEAAELHYDALDLVKTYEQAHPLVLEIAQNNVVLTAEVIELATDAALISKQTAATISRLDIVESDLRVSQDLIDTGALDRRAGATLRRLSYQLTSPAVIKSEMKETQKSRIDVTQRRLIAQETLREIPLGRVNSDLILNEARLTNPELPMLTEVDESALQIVMSNRRDILQRIVSTSSSRVTDTANLYELQKELLFNTETLKSLLDEKLLWVPSVPGIDFGWPAKVIKGIFSVFSPENIALTLNVFIVQAQSLWFLVAIFGLVIALCASSRKRLWEDIIDRSKQVGRVQKDNYWHTPSVIFSCIIIALPFPLAFLLLSLMYEFSNSPDPLVEGLADTFLYVALFSLFLLTWRAWDRDKSLFAAHYKLPENFRANVNTHLRWFIPVAGTATAFIALTESSADPNVYEGFSLFAFVVTALALSYFAFKILWSRRKVLASNFGADSFFSKYKGPLTLALVGLPLIAALLSLFGYYDTASELLGRLFFSAWLFLLTYVVHGLIKRTILVAQRQIAFRQAVEKRDAAAKVRAEQLEAEQRGEEIAPPPPLDTSEIDIKAMSRQSSQLLNTLIVLGFATLMWVIWSDLLPALSIFNEVKIGDYTTQIVDEAGAMRDIEVPITLWSLIQAFVILALTFIAAKNLPGFLEIFVLNRAGVDAGTRYAVKTILGYIIVAIGVVIGFDRLGLQWSQLRWIVTGLSVGIGFGLQKIIANFISGLIILFERPVRIGDYVTIGQQSGTVSRIQIRATTLMDLENREILIPNEALISERVTNWTLSNAVTRLTVPVGIAYGSDTDAARNLMLDTLKANNKILENPAPQVLFVGFGDSSLDFELRVFLKNFDDRVPVKHMVHTDIYRALEKADISIPFPQRDLNIVSQNIPLELVEKAKDPKRKTTKSKPKTS
jgi:potassium efflux system protein